MCANIKNVSQYSFDLIQELVIDTLQSHMLIELKSLPIISNHSKSVKYHLNYSVSGLVDKETHRIIVCELRHPM